MAEFIDYYQVLKITRDATDEEIRRAYRELAKHCHPDRNPSPEAHEAFLALGRAYKILGDQQKRTQYNFRHDRHSGRTPKQPQGGPSSLQRARAKRASRYQRGRAYSSRIRYRGTTAQPGQEEERPEKRKGASPAAEAQAEIYRRYAEVALAREEGKVKGYQGFARLMQLCCMVILGACLFMVVDRGLPVRKAKEAVTRQVELPWSIEKPGLNRVATQSRIFDVPRSAAEELEIGRLVVAETSLFSNIPLRVYYQAYGREFAIRVNSPFYGGFFPLIWIMILMCLATLIFRGNVEFNAYLGMFTLILAVIASGIMLNSS